MDQERKTIAATMEPLGASTCTVQIVTTFFDTLDVGDTTCAGPQPDFEG